MKESIISKLFKSFKRLDDDFLEELEETLILSDMGVATTDKMMQELRTRAKKDKIQDTEQVKTVLKEIIAQLTSLPAPKMDFPAVLLIAGVNGVGKTTAIGKMAHVFAKSGKKVLLAAADTFRAAAGDQLKIWGDRANVPVIKYSQDGADPAAVVYDAVDSAKAKGIDLLICDTAGRLHNKKNLMSELEKIGRVIEREYPAANRYNYIVIDATTGQNALVQAKMFGEILDINGLILTKLDGTAKGGIAVSIIDQLKIPIAYIGVGEGIDDLKPFDPKEFADNIL